MADEPVRLDHPNQQVVRPDASGPADEGDGAGKAARKASAGRSKDKAGNAPPDAEAAEKG